MPTVSILDTKGKAVGEIELAQTVFGVEPNVPAMHLMVRSYLANQRQGTQSALTRAEVRGGGRKPWRQKGTGRARQGSTRSPQWTHGGVVFAPKPRDYSFDINRKVKRLAMKSALSSKVLDEQMIVLSSVDANEYKTKAVVELMKNIGADKKALFVLPEVDAKFIASARNIPGVKTAQINTLNVYDILNADKIIVLKDAVSKIEEVYA